VSGIPHPNYTHLSTRAILLDLALPERADQSGPQRCVGEAEVPRISLFAPHVRINGTSGSSFGSGRPESGLERQRGGTRGARVRNRRRMRPPHDRPCYREQSPPTSTASPSATLSGLTGGLSVRATHARRSADVRARLLRQSAALRGRRAEINTPAVNKSSNPASGDHWQGLASAREA
jgi:hypothetical protein